MIVAGPGVPKGRVVEQPVSHIDCAPAILESAGVAPIEPLPGCSLFDIANGQAAQRPVLSEYHAIGSSGGAFMLRHGRYKYCRYVHAPPQLFDLESDPEELVDLAGDPRRADTLAECEARLRRVLDPDEVDARAKSRQAALLAEFGGREKALARGDLGFTPAPGSKPDMN
jgi:choline-sulfatase